MMCAMGTFKTVFATAAISFAVLQSRAGESVNIFEGFSKTGTRKFVGDAKSTESLRRFLNKRTRDGLKWRLALDIVKIARHRPVVAL